MLIKAIGLGIENLSDGEKVVTQVAKSNWLVFDFVQKLDHLERNGVSESG